jgi:hypothetical protein
MTGLTVPVAVTREVMGPRSTRRVLYVTGGVKDAHQYQAPAPSASRAVPIPMIQGRRDAGRARGTPMLES